MRAWLLRVCRVLHDERLRGGVHADQRLLLRARQCHAKRAALPGRFLLHLHVRGAGALRGRVLRQRAGCLDAGLLWVLRSGVLVSDGVHKLVRGAVPRRPLRECGRPRHGVVRRSMHPRVLLRLRIDEWHGSALPAGEVWVQLGALRRDL